MKEIEEARDVEESGIAMYIDSLTEEELDLLLLELGHEDSDINSDL